MLLFFTLLMAPFLMIPESGMAVGYEHNHSDIGLNIEAPLQRPSGRIGTGPVHFPLEGLEPDSEAQLLLNEALSLSHGFFLYEAERRLREFIRLNPDHPMGYALLAHTQLVFGSGNKLRGKKYLALARLKEEELPVSKPLPKREKLWLEATAAWYEKSEDEYIDLLEEIGKTFPDDMEAKAFLALALWESTSDETKKSPEALAQRRARIDAIVDEVLSKFPSHPVHHYRIHLWDGDGNSQLATRSARIAGQASPDVAHMWHMPGHIYWGRGHIHNAAWQHAKAHLVDLKYLLKHRLAPDHIHNFAHNFDYTSDRLSRAAKIKQAQFIIEDMLLQPRLNVSGSLYWLAGIRAVILTERYSDWDYMLKLERQGLLIAQTQSVSVMQKGPLKGEKNAGTRMMLAMMIERGRLLARLFGKSTPQEKAEVEAILANLSALRNEILNGENDLHIKNQARDILNDANIWYGHGTTRNPRLSAEDYEVLKSAGISPVSRQVEAYDSTDHNQAIDDLEDFLAKNPSDLAAMVTMVKLLQGDLLIDTAKQRVDALMQKIKTLVPAEVFSFENQLNRDLKAIGLGSEISNDFVHPNRDPHMGEADPDLENLRLGWPKLPDLSRFNRVHNEIQTNQSAGNYSVLVLYFGRECLGCFEQLRALQDAFPVTEQQNIQIVLSAVEDEGGVELFKTMGAFDEFREKPTHGLFLIDPSGNLRWYLSSEHAYSNVPFVVEEWRRLQRIAVPND